MTQEQLTVLLDQYDPLTLECDGLTRVLDYVLTKNKIPHKVFIGKACFEEILLPVHYWIEIEDLRIDYRLRMWCGDKAPHGVFPVKDCQAQYLPFHEINLDTSKTLFDILFKLNQPIKIP